MKQWPALVPRAIQDHDDRGEQILVPGSGAGAVVRGESARR